MANIFDLVFSITPMLIGWSTAMYYFLYYEIDMIGLELSIINIMAGGGFIVIMVATLAKKWVPFL